MRTFLLITFLAFSLFSEPSYKFGLGYESGLSFRYFPSNFGVGIVLGPIGSANARSLYYSQNVSDTLDANYYNSDIVDKGLMGTISGYYRFNLKMFNATPFITMGYGFSQRHHTMETNSTVYSYKRDYHTVIGEFGVLPGFSYKRVSVEAKLGINARYGFSRAPESSNINGLKRQNSETEKSLDLIYPTDIVKGLILHFWF